jgi:hypothetical protein
MVSNEMHQKAVMKVLKVLENKNSTVDYSINRNTEEELK